MREIIISTESGSDLPQELIDRYGFYVVPMHVIIDDVDYADGTIPVDMVFDHFEKTGFRRMYRTHGRLLGAGTGSKRYCHRLSGTCR